MHVGRVGSVVLCVLALAAAGCGSAAKPSAEAAPAAASGAQVAGIHAAAEAGNVAKVRELLQANPSLANARDDHGGTPLHSAVFNGQKAAVELLLASGADVNAPEG